MFDQIDLYMWKSSVKIDWKLYAPKLRSLGECALWPVPVVGKTLIICQGPMKGGCCLSVKGQALLGAKHHFRNIPNWTYIISRWTPKSLRSQGSAGLGAKQGILDSNKSATFTQQTSGIFWDILGYFGIFWCILGYFAIFWDILGYFGMFWDMFGYFGIFWDVLNYSGILWDILRYFWYFCIFWDILEYFGICLDILGSRYSGIFWVILGYSGIFVIFVDMFLDILGYFGTFGLGWTCWEITFHRYPSVTVIIFPAHVNLNPHEDWAPSPKQLGIAISKCSL